MEDAITTTRTLTVDLSPPILAGEGLVEAIHWLTEQMQELHHLNVTLEVQERLPALAKEIRVLLFQLVREILFNVIKHAGVDEARVVVGQNGKQLVIAIEDEGRGFDPRIANEKKESEAGWGLFHIRERLELFDGKLEVKSAPDRGTRVAIFFPLW